MKLKSKIFTSVIILMILPIILAFISIYMVSNYETIQMQSKYGVDSDTIESIANPVRILDWLTSSSYKQIKDYVEETPDSLKDKIILQEINDNMNTTYSFLAVRKDDEFIYVGNEYTFKKINQPFPDYSEDVVEESLTEPSHMVYLGGDYPCLVKQVNFRFTDKSKGSAFIVININKVVPEIKVLATEVIVVLICVMLITGTILVSWIYKSMLKPINKLSIAAQRISGGDLDFEIKQNMNEDIGSLVNDFENMRSRLKSLIEAQQAYEKESRELISNISHDLKTPLTAIKGYSEGLIDGVADTDAKKEKYLMTIYNKAIDMTSLVDELSLYSKLDGNLMPYTFVKINIDDYFTDCVDEMSLDAEVQGITMDYVNSCEPNTMVVMDVEQIKRVVNNVISNAVKYIGEKDGKIEVKLSDVDEYVKIEIKDNGKGISKEDQKYIFDRFYRTDASRNSAQGGTGLGLSIAKKIIERHGGTIGVNSSEGVGTNIFFTLPKESKDSVKLISRRNKKKYGYSFRWYNRKRSTDKQNATSQKSEADKKNKSGKKDGGTSDGKNTDS